MVSAQEGGASRVEALPPQLSSYIHRCGDGGVGRDAPNSDLLLIEGQADGGGQGAPEDLAEVAADEGVEKGVEGAVERGQAEAEEHPVPGNGLGEGLEKAADIVGEPADDKGRHHGHDEADGLPGLGEAVPPQLPANQEVAGDHDRHGEAEAPRRDGSLHPSCGIGPRYPMMGLCGDALRLKSFKFPGVNITNSLSWSNHVDATVKKAHQRLYFLRRLKKFGLSPLTLTNFYQCTIESILSGCITAWYGNCSAQDLKKLQRVVDTAQRITDTSLPSLDSVFTSRCLGEAASIIKDPTHPGHPLFSPLPSGRRYRILRTRTTRLKDSFYPTVIRLLNGSLIR
ncbi:uncharacterized protein LOC127566556 [Pristis pectinata]|uniref:uncharacterized protein LOC127566556 n=1 Tax=Pristis pectinata TaxID=685728 RepID=UPI00223E1A84|nr:uncharacterized protein LOC127566556 [Pristis pectinata]